MKKSLSNGMKNYETRRSSGYCGHCGKITDALWGRNGEKLIISCEECGTIILIDNNRFKPKPAMLKGGDDE